MPGGDGTGPGGLGPMTGRAAGFCAGYPVPGYMNPIGGSGSWGAGRGFFGRGGRGRRNWYYATGLPGWNRAGMGLPAWGMGSGAYPGSYGAGYVPPYAAYPSASQITPQQEIDALKGEAEYFEDVLDGIRKGISELEKAKTEKK